MTVGYWLRNFRGKEKYFLEKVIKQYEWGIGKKITKKDLIFYLNKVR